MEAFLEPIIITRKLSMQYHPPKGPVALKNIDLEIKEGEIFSLLGPNAAGKTTFISILCGLFPPTAGDATVAGHSVVQDAMSVKQIVGVVPEEIALYTRLTGRQNLRYFGSLYDLERRELDRSIEEVLAIIGLTERARERVADYSNGMKRRLNIAVGLLHKPRILLMDEPTLGLDPESRRTILDLVKRLKQEAGVTILYTTHNMDEAQEISDRVGIIHCGQIIACGSTDELIQAIHGEDIIHLRVDEARVPSGTLDILQQIKKVKHISFDEDMVSLSVASAADVLPEILRIVRRAGIGIRTLTVQRPNLETVFLKLTGRPIMEASDGNH